MANEHGGQREGAGRKKSESTLASEEMRNQLVLKVKEYLDPLMDAYLDSALGLHMETVDKDGVTRQYQKAPDIAALKSLIDQAMGRAKESVEHSGSMTLEDLYSKASQDSKEE